VQAFYSVRSASATVNTSLVTLWSQSIPTATLAFEGGGELFFISRNMPAGISAGARLAVPIIAGFEIVGGFQWSDIKNKTLPFVSDYAFLAVAYRLDFFRHLDPYVEAGGGFFGLYPQNQERASLRDFGFHLGLGCDYFFSYFLVGAYVRYHVFYFSGLDNFPAAVSGGIRLGIRLFE